MHVPGGLNVKQYVNCTTFDDIGYTLYPTSLAVVSVHIELDMQTVK